MSVRMSVHGGVSVAIADTVAVACFLLALELLEVPVCAPEHPNRE